MKRIYTHVKIVEKEILEIKASGKTSKENWLRKYYQNETADHLRDMFQLNRKKTMK